MMTIMYKNPPDVTAAPVHAQVHAPVRVMKVAVQHVRSIAEHPNIMAKIIVRG